MQAKNPYTWKIFFLFCVSSHHSITQGLYNPIRRKAKQVQLKNKNNNLT